MQGTVEFELKPLLDLEMEFNHIPGLPRTGIDYPREDPTYEIERIRVFYQEKWRIIPKWLEEFIINHHYDALVGKIKEVI